MYIFVHELSAVFKADLPLLSDLGISLYPAYLGFI